ncbi:MAG: DegV family protein [Eggerthellaceae bacterium]|nr:DegV family protein [Eggerthellaceae bacterium]
MTPQCNLIIDSCCDLPFEVLDREGVEILEFPYIIDNVEHTDDLYRSLSAADFFQKMRQGAQPTTAQLSVQSLQSVFQRVADSGIPAVYLSFASALSGSFDVAQMVLSQFKEEHPDAEIYIVDTRLASAAEGLLVYEAIHQRDQGLTAFELAQWAAEAYNYVNCEFMVDDLGTLRRGGRIPASVAYAGSKLDVKPMLSEDLEGKLCLVGVAHGRRKGIKQMADLYAKRASSTGSGRYVIVANADCPKDAQRLKEELLKVDESIVFIETSIGPVIGSHVGPDMVALVFWGPDRRDNLSVADMIARKVRGEH